MRCRIAFCCAGLAAVCLALAPMAAAQGGDIPRTPSGRPDLSGTYDVSTLTPMERPTELGENMALTEEEAATAEARAAETQTALVESIGGKIGAYNAFWFDIGTNVVSSRQ